MRIAVGCDHRGLSLKKKIIELLTDAKHDYEDFGTYTEDSVDYPDIAKKVAEAVASGQCEYGILTCGTGIGMSIAANKVRGIRAALCHDEFGARRSRQHNNANILCMATEAPWDAVPMVVNTFLSTDFESERHQRRIDKIRALEG